MTRRGKLHCSILAANILLPHSPAGIMNYHNTENIDNTSQERNIDH